MGTLARAEASTWCAKNVRIEDLAAVVLNIPMSSVTGWKFQIRDRPRADIGDAVAYRLEIHHPTAAPVSDVVVHDRLPTSFHYV